MPSPRWRKVIRDLRGHPARTLLVVLSIAAGTAAIGALAGTRAILAREMTAAYLAIQPAHAVLYAEPFAEPLLEAVRRVEGVAVAEARRSVGVRVHVGAGTWRDLELIAIPDFRGLRVDQVRPWRGAWPPPEGELLLERESAALLGVGVGDRLTLQPPRGRERQLRVAGLAHDLARPPAVIAGQASGYVTLETLARLGEPRAFDEIHLRVEGDPRDRAHVRRVAEAVRAKLERGGHRVLWMYLPQPDRHPAGDILDALLLVLGALGGLTLLAGTLLAVNTVSAVLTQEVRQIGIMKAVGARASQVAGLYLALVAGFGLLALALALPAAALAARALSAYVGRLANTDIADFSLPASVLALQALCGLGVPLAAAWAPVRAGARVTVREALAAHGGAGPGLGGGALERALAAVRGLPRPVALSLRNAFRRRGRLALTVLALGVAGATFVAVFSVRASLLATLDDVLRYWQYDVEVAFDRPYRVEELRREALAVPGVAAAESWLFAGARRARPDGGEEQLVLVGLPPASRAIEPALVAGRWLLPADERALVVSSEVLERNPDVHLGAAIRLELDGSETEWRVVGVVRGAGAGALAYAPYGHLSRVLRAPGRATSVLAVGRDHSPEAQRELARRLERHFRARGYGLRSVDSVAFHRERNERQFGILVGFLLSMALLLAGVGALGLAGTLSLNVLERTREIGVMRAIGATDRDVRRVVLAEGLVIGLLSWAVGTLLAWPVSRLLSDGVGLAFIGTPLRFSFATAGPLLWLGVAAVLSTLAGLLPAWRASRLTVREVLSYE